MPPIALEPLLLVLVASAAGGLLIMIGGGLWMAEPAPPNMPLELDPTTAVVAAAPVGEEPDEPVADEGAAFSPDLPPVPLVLALLLPLVVPLELELGAVEALLAAEAAEAPIPFVKKEKGPPEAAAGAGAVTPPGDEGVDLDPAVMFGLAPLPPLAPTELGGVPPVPAPPLPVAPVAVAPLAVAAPGVSVSIIKKLIHSSARLSPCNPLHQQLD